MSRLMRFEKSARFAWRASASPTLLNPASAFAPSVRAWAPNPPPQQFALADPLSHRSTPPFLVSAHRGKQPHRRRRAGAGGSGRIRRSDDWPVGFGVFCGNAARHAENTRHSSPGRPHQAFTAFVAIAIVAIDIMPVWAAPGTWLVSRALLGFAFSGIYAVIESWIRAKASNTNRGALYGVYQIVNFVASASGQLLLRGLDPQRFRSVHDRRILVCARHSPARDDPRRRARGAAQREPAAVAAPRSLPDFGRCGVGGRRCQRRGFRALRRSTRWASASNPPRCRCSQSPSCSARQRASIPRAGSRIASIGGS